MECRNRETHQHGQRASSTSIVATCPIDLSRNSFCLKPIVFWAIIKLNRSTRYSFYSFSSGSLIVHSLLIVTPKSMQFNANSSWKLQSSSKRHLRGNRMLALEAPYQNDQNDSTIRHPSIRMMSYDVIRVSFIIHMFHR